MAGRKQTFTPEFRAEAVRLAQTSGRSRREVMVETFFKTLKSELVWRTAFQTRAEATVALARYIDGFYDPRRRHSALGFTRPIQFERGLTHQTALH